MGSVDPSLAGRCEFFPLGRLGPKMVDEYCYFSDESDFVRLRLQTFSFVVLFNVTAGRLALLVVLSSFFLFEFCGKHFCNEAKEQLEHKIFT